MLSAVHVEEKPTVEKVDIKDLTWTDKENILRVLFSKMNGVSLANEAEQRSKSQEELDNTRKHREGFTEVVTKEPEKVRFTDISVSESSLAV